MVELPLEEVMELKSNRKLPPWRPRLLFCACREQSRRAQGLARLSARAQETGAAPEPCGGSVPELLCPLRAGRWLWELGRAALSGSTVCARVSRSCQTQEMLKVNPKGKQPSPEWIRVSWDGGGIPRAAGVQSTGVWQRGQRDLGAKDPEAGSAGISIRAGILASFSASVPLIIHPSPVPSVLSPPAGVRMAGMPGLPVPAPSAGLLSYGASAISRASLVFALLHGCLREAAAK